MVDIVNIAFPIIIDVLLIILIAVAIVMIIKVINILNKASNVLDNVEDKINSLNSLFGIINKINSSVDFISEKVIGYVTNIFTGLFKNKKEKLEEEEELESILEKEGK